MSTPAPGAPDRVRVHPAALEGRVDVVGDKSIGHRCLLVGALSDTPVDVAGIPGGADVLASASALRALGATVTLSPAADGALEGRVEGPLAADPDGEPVRIDCGNSGTTLRLLAGLAAGSGRHVVLDGDASLRRRPVDRVRAPLEAMGVLTSAREDRFPPLTVRAGRVAPLDWTSPVASAQVKSLILLGGIAGAVPVTVRSPHPSRDHTERMLRYGGCAVTTLVDDEGREVVSARPGRPHLTRLHAPRDPSAAAFWHVAAACGAGTVLTPGLAVNEGRTGALEVLGAMGADVRLEGAHEDCGEPVSDVRVAPGSLGAAEVAGALVVRCLDELPVLALAGGLSEGGLQVRDAAELRVKESDRISVLASMLGAIGIVVEERPDGFGVAGGQRPTGGRVDARGDHRIAMTAAVAGCLGTDAVDIDGFACVATSYPGFLDDLRSLGGRVEILDD